MPIPTSRITRLGLLAGSALAASLIALGCGDSDETRPALHGSATD